MAYRFDHAYISDDGEVGDHVEDLEPDADVLGSLGHGAPRLADELLGVESNLDPVVEQREEGGQREGRNENGDEAELQNWNDEAKVLFHTLLLYLCWLHRWRCLDFYCFSLLLPLQ